MFQLIMPKMGESVAEATILKWLKKEGDKIEVDEPVLEIATDKVDTEVPSPSAGILSKKMYEEGQVVKVGQVVALIDNGEGKPASNTVSSNGKAETEKIKAESILETAPSFHTVATIDAPLVTAGSAKFYTPLVKNIAKQEGVTVAELDSIKGSGMNERVTKNDLLSYIEIKKNQSASSPASKPFVASTYTAPTISVSGNTEIIEMDRMRKLIADHMVIS